MLQQNRVLTSIRTASVKKILSELKSVAANQPEQYLKFITQYNRPLKEGLYSDFANREFLLDLIRFKSTKAEGLTQPGRSKVAHEGRAEQYLLHYRRRRVPAAHIRHCSKFTRRRILKS